METNDPNGPVTTPASHVDGLKPGELQATHPRAVAGGETATASPDGPNPNYDHILQYFECGHLPPHLQTVSRPFGDLALFIQTLPRNPERSVALRKLLEAKDAAVRAALAPPVG